MLKIETDLTRGGQPVLRLTADANRTGERMCYLAVDVLTKTVSGATVRSGSFIGITKEEVAQLRAALKHLEEIEEQCLS